MVTELLNRELFKKFRDTITSEEVLTKQENVVTNNCAHIFIFNAQNVSASEYEYYQHIYSMIYVEIHINHIKKHTHVN